MVRMKVTKLIAELFRKTPPRPVEIPEFLPILEELAQIWRAVTVDDLRRAEADMRKIMDGERKLGTIYSDASRRTLVVSHRLKILTAEAVIAAVGAATETPSFNGASSASFSDRRYRLLRR